MNSSFLQRKAPQIALVIMTMIWGGTFVVVQHALNYSSPMFLVGSRFAIAALIVGLLSFKYMRGITRQEIFAGALIGAAISAGYGTQTVGMQTISSSESAFLTALYVPLVPILLWLIFRKVPHIMTLIGIVFAFIGLIFLTGNGLNQIQLNSGQIITIIGSVAIALEIILIGYFAGKVNIRRVTVIQLIFASIISFAAMPLAGEYELPTFSWGLIYVAIALGLTSALLQSLMNWAQRYVPPSQAAIIYAGEPVWAALFGRIVGERLPALALLGGLLVVIGVIISEIRFKPFKKSIKKSDEVL
ncbi:EamA family transporter [Acinetobacter sp. ANC 4558]|uniref:DMT family transporter n=1 Tax=Acinetobacter sp. ANC 4558 TaxID=1977876 RepID=UPI000A33B6E4|nr:DMT family transporter [Acinetobacter sp. ANC 4558]OTG88130.1 EamA family transporter [Acinetobacter sp. ANC 4558]